MFTLRIFLFSLVLVVLSRTFPIDNHFKKIWSCKIAEVNKTKKEHLTRDVRHVSIISSNVCSC